MHADFEVTCTLLYSVYIKWMAEHITSARLQMGLYSGVERDASMPGKPMRRIVSNQEAYLLKSEHKKNMPHSILCREICPKLKTNQVRLSHWAASGNLMGLLQNGQNLNPSWTKTKPDSNWQQKANAIRAPALGSLRLQQKWVLEEWAVPYE